MILWPFAAFPRWLLDQNFHLGSSQSVFENCFVIFSTQQQNSLKSISKQTGWTNQASFAQIIFFSWCYLLDWREDPPGAGGRVEARGWSGGRHPFFSLYILSPHVLEVRAPHPPHPRKGRGGPYLEVTTFPPSPHYSILLSVATVWGRLNLKQK